MGNTGTVKSQTLGLSKKTGPNRRMVLHVAIPTKYLKSVLTPRATFHRPPCSGLLLPQATGFPNPMAFFFLCLFLFSKLVLLKMLGKRWKNHLKSQKITQKEKHQAWPTCPFCQTAFSSSFQTNSSCSPWTKSGTSTHEFFQESSATSALTRSLQQPSTKPVD